MVVREYGAKRDAGYAHGDQAANGIRVRRVGGLAGSSAPLNEGWEEERHRSNSANRPWAVDVPF